MNFLIPCPICDEKTRLTSFVWFNQKIISCKICNMFYCPKIIYREIDSNSTPTPDENLSMLLNLSTMYPKIIRNNIIIKNVDIFFLLQINLFSCKNKNANLPH